MNVDGQAIALLHAVDGNRAALRIEKGKLQFRGRAVLFAGDDAAEGVLGLDHEDIAGIDREHRLGIRPIDIMEVALRRDRELVALASLPLGKPACRHDRSLEPGIVDHRDILESMAAMQIARRNWIAPSGPSSASSRRRPRSPSKLYQRGLLEMAPNQHQTDRQTVNPAAWHGEGRMSGNVERAGIRLHI